MIKISLSSGKIGVGRRGTSTGRTVLKRVVWGGLSAKAISEQRSEGLKGANYVERVAGRENSKRKKRA